MTTASRVACTTASRSRSSASASSRSRPTTPRRRSRRRWRPATATSTPPPPTATRRASAPAIAASGLPRDEIFVTTKLWNTEQGYDSTLAAFEKSLERLGIDHVDLYLIHWPVPTAGPLPRHLAGLRTDPRARAARARSASPTSASRTSSGSKARPRPLPTVNQIELHPRLQQAELRAWHAEHGIATEAWSPLAQGAAARRRDDRRRSPTATARPPAQAILRWHLQLGNVVIPKSVTPARIRENLDLFDFELSDDDMAAIAGLDAGHAPAPTRPTFVAPVTHTLAAEGGATPPADSTDRPSGRRRGRPQHACGGCGSTRSRRRPL